MRWQRMAGFSSRWGAPLGLLGLVILHLYGAVPYQNDLRTFSFDVYQLAYPRERVSAPVVIVDIDEASLAEFGQWPWPRSLTAQLLNRVTEMQPAAVALDIIMPEADRTSPCELSQYIPAMDPGLARQLCRLPGNDALLAAALKRANAVIGVAGLDDDSAAANIRAAPVLITGFDPRPWLRHFRSALSNVPELQQAAPGHAILSADLESGIVRRIPLAATVGDTILPALSLETLRIASGSPAFRISSSARGVTGVGVADLHIPTQQDGTLWVHYSPHDPARFVSAAQILKGEIDPQQLQRKLVLIGFSGLGLVDFPSTALGERVPGVEIHAQVLETIFDGTTLLRPHWAPWLEGAIMLGLGLAIILGFPRLRARIMLPIVVAIAALLVGLGFVIFRQQHLLLDMASPMVLFVALFGAMLGDSLLREERQLARLEADLRREREEAAKVQGEMEAAKRFQMGIVPDAQACFAGEPRLDIAARMEPAKMVGGDLYDCFMLDQHRVFFSLGDVCGKGVPASLFMVISKTLCKSVALREDMHNMDLGLLMRQANMEISRDNPEMLFVTAFIGLLDLRSGLLTYCNAGHEKPLIAAYRCHAKELEGMSGPPLSVMDDCAYKTHQYRMSSEEYLCIFSDGITEAFNPHDEQYGRERLVYALQEIRSSDEAADIVDRIARGVHAFADGAEPSDDLTVMVVRWRGTG